MTSSVDEVLKESSRHVDDIKVLICSANIGNKAPTQDSLWEWIPADGRIKDVVDKTNNSDDELPNEEKGDEFFDIIAIGMQESSFEVNHKSDSNLNANNRLSDNSEMSSEEDDEEEEEQTTSMRVVTETLEAVASATATTAAKATKEIFNKAVLKPGKDIRSALGTVDGTKNNLLYQTATEFYGMDTNYLRTMLKERCPSYQIRCGILLFSRNIYAIMLVFFSQNFLLTYTHFENTVWITYEEKCDYLF